MSLVSKYVLICDMLKLSRLTGSLKSAYCYLKQENPLNEIECAYRCMRFKARRGDWPALREVFINHEYACLPQLFKPSDKPVMLDMGAHIGSFALYAFAHNSRAKIVSVEAAQDTSKIIEENSAFNPDADWRIIYGAVWKENTQVNLERSESSLGHKIGSKNSGDQVEGLTPDKIIEGANLEQIDFVKMDIEGAEQDVISVCDQLIDKARFFLIEVHNDRIENGQEIFDTLNKRFACAFKMGDRWSDKPVFLFCKEDIGVLKGWTRIAESF